MLSEFYDLYGINKELFIFINSITNVSILPYFLQIISGIFKIWNFAIIYIIICIYLILKLRRNYSDQDTFNDVFNEMFRIGIIYAFFGLAYAAMKYSINMPRPYCSMNASDFTTIANLSDIRCHSSFPSAHAALAILVAYFLWSHVKSIGKIFIVLVVLLVAISRITLAMHYPSDIIYSAIITGFIVLAGNFFCRVLTTNPLMHIKNFVYIIAIAKQRN